MQKSENRRVKSRWEVNVMVNQGLLMANRQSSIFWVLGTAFWWNPPLILNRCSVGHPFWRPGRVFQATFFQASNHEAMSSTSLPEARHHEAMASIRMFHGTSILEAKQGVPGNILPHTSRSGCSMEHWASPQSHGFRSRCSMKHCTTMNIVPPWLQI